MLFRSVLATTSIIVLLCCAASYYAKVEPNDTSAISKIFEEEIARTAEKTQLENFVAKVENKIRPLELRLIDGETSLGVGYYYFGISGLPLMRIFVRTVDIASLAKKMKN